MNVSASVAGATSATQGSSSVLSPVDRISEVLFGLIMALTFTGTLSVATAERSEVREMLIGALGCNIAWGLVDAVMFLLAALTERGRNITILREVRQTADPARARALILDALPPLVASTMQPAEVDVIRDRLGRLPDPGRLSLGPADLRMAVGVFLLVFLATLPVALPFAFIHEAHRALRLSNGIALAMLFLGGYYLGGHAGRRPWMSGLVMLAIGVLLVWATIALGG
ncbi:MAG TPA: VIT1/CCC1 transporter family protein [Gemmatimonadales bacterium]|nr:VIT1/CCC1 transporter family protein [Gemmatimonadales bacterium]